MNQFAESERAAESDQYEQTETEKVCDECGHRAIVPPTASALVRRVFGLRPRPAGCPVRVEDVSGLGTLPCGCDSPQHGS